MKKTILAAGLLLPILAIAGSKSTSPVTINTTSRYAYGQTGTARNSADYSQTLGCWTDDGPT